MSPGFGRVPSWIVPPAVELDGQRKHVPGVLAAASGELTRLALTPKEAARALGIGVRLLWTKTNCGEIPSMKIGRRTVYPIHLLQEWMTRQARQGGNHDE